jgi:hypothetical protein
MIACALHVRALSCFPPLNAHFSNVARPSPDSRIASPGLFLPKRRIEQERTTHLRFGDIV